MNTNEIITKAEEIKGIMSQIENYEYLLREKEEKGGYEITPIGMGIRAYIKSFDEDYKDVDRIINNRLLNCKNILHEMNGEPLEEIQEQKTNYEKFDTILKEINKDEYENYSSKTELMTVYLADYKNIRDIITKNVELVESAVDKNTSTEYYKLVDYLIDTIDYKTGYISDLEEKVSELEEKNKKLSREMFDDVNDKNIFRNQIREHLKEMDLICKAH